MCSEKAIEAGITAYVDAHRDRLIDSTRWLVRIPSENKPPSGAEKACQEHVARILRDLGLQPDVYELGEVEGLQDHPLYWPGREYKDRPNVAARMKGTGRGRSLVLSGHIDTVPAGTLPWSRNPFSGEIEGNRLYGRGSNDMKAGIAMNLFVFEALRDMGLQLAGDLIFESVVDEEFGGVNGTLAGRIRGYNADAAIITEPSLLRICPGHRGGRTAHITFKAPGGILQRDRFPSGVVDQLTCFLNAVKGFAEHRRLIAPRHGLFGSSDPVPVSVTKVFTSPWGTGEPLTVPETCRVEMYWQLMPGETQEAVDGEFFNWFDETLAGAPELFASRPDVSFPIRWLPGYAMPDGEPLVAEFSACAARVTGNHPRIEGTDGPCDMYVFHQGFGIPAILWGPRGGNTHGADEYVEIDSLITATKALLLFICKWCGVAE